jgi:hypothetical protein
MFNILGMSVLVFMFFLCFFLLFDCIHKWILFSSNFSLFRPQKRGPGQAHVRSEERRGPKRPVAEPRFRLDSLDYFIKQLCLFNY